MNEYRGTGRTTRMMEKAIHLDQEGKAVYVIVSSLREISRFQKMLHQPTGIKIETWDTLGSFDEKTMQLRGAHRNCEVLVDHAAIGSRYRRMLTELHAYDLRDEYTTLKAQLKVMETRKLRVELALIEEGGYILGDPFLTNEMIDAKRKRLAELEGK